MTRLIDILKRKNPHYHTNEQGLLVKCYHSCAELLTKWQFWAGLTLGFPLEHFLWEKVWPFYVFSEWLEHLEKFSAVETFAVMVILLTFGMISITAGLRTNQNKEENETVRSSTKN